MSITLNTANKTNLMNPTQVAESWKEIVSIYENTVHKNKPALTMENIIFCLDFIKARETFAVIAAFKKNDGRISPSNRAYITSIPFDYKCLNINNYNPIIYSGIDRIHTAHIDNLISELRKLDK